MEKRQHYMDPPLTGAGVLVCLWMASVEKAGIDIPDQLLVSLVELIEEYADEVRGGA